MACKPGSVCALRGDGTTIPLGGTLRYLSSNQPGPPQHGGAPVAVRQRGVPIRFCSGWGLPCLVCCQPSGALLPHPFTVTPTCEVVYSLWRFPLDRSSRALPGTLPPGSPDFPRRPKGRRSRPAI